MGTSSELREAIGRLAGDLDALDGRDLGARLQELERLARVLEHTIVDVVGEANRRAVWAEDGHRSVRSWCMATANWSWGETTARLRTVTLLDDLPVCDEALAAGTVGVAQVRELARARANPRCGDQLAEVEELLVQYAKDLPFDDFRRLSQRWESLADVDGAHRDHEAAHHHRNVDVDLVGPEFHLTARGGAAQGAAIKEIFDRFVDAEFQADWDECKARYGDDAAVDLLARTARQRRFDALHALFLAAASTPPGAQAPEPVVNIVIDQTTFETALAAAIGDEPLTAPVPPAPPDPTRQRCETLDGALLDPLDVLAAAVVGHVRRVVYDTASTTIDLGAGEPAVHRPVPPRRLAPGHPMYLARLRAPPLPDRPHHRVERPRRNQPGKRRTVVPMAQPLEDPRLPNLARPQRHLAHLPTRRHRDHRRVTRTVRSAHVRVAHRRSEAGTAWVVTWAPGAVDDVDVEYARLAVTRQRQPSGQ